MASPETIMVSIDLKSLLSELRCPICFEILMDTFTVMECLHRFCKRCIERVLRADSQSLHSCPSCRRQLGHRRSLRKDTNYDELIKLLGARDVCEDTSSQFNIVQYRIDHARKTAELIEASRRQRQRERSVGQGVAAKKRSRAAGDDKGEGAKIKETKKKPAPLVPEPLPPPAPPVDIAKFLVCLKLVNRTSMLGTTDAHALDALPMPFIRVPADTTVSTIKQYVREKHTLAEGMSVSLAVGVDEQMVELEDDATLFRVCAEMWRPTTELLLTYAVSSD